MGDEKFVADSMVDIIRGIVREEINKTDSTLLCCVKNIYSENAVDVVPVSDKTLTLHNIPNMTKYNLNIGDYVYIYRINNQLDNSFVCYVLGKNPVETSYSASNMSAGGPIRNFVPILAYNTEEDTLSLSNYTELVAAVEQEGLSLTNLEVGVTVKKHSRSGTRRYSKLKDPYGDLSYRDFPSLDKNRATSWGGMFVDKVRIKFFFSLEENGVLKVSKSRNHSTIENSSFAEWIWEILPRGGGSTGKSTNFKGFEYSFLGLKFRVGGRETAYSKNSLAFSASDRYLSDDWDL